MDGKASELNIWPGHPRLTNLIVHFSGKSNTYFGAGILEVPKVPGGASKRGEEFQ